MRRLLATLLVATMSCSGVAGDMTADQLIAKHLEAIGGEKNIRAVESVFFQGTAFMQGTPLEMKMWFVLPDKSYTEVSMNDMVMGGSGCNGDQVWATQMGQTYYLEGDMKLAAQRQADVFPLLDYSKKGSKATYIGEATVKGDKAHKMEFVVAEGDTSYYYFDAANFHLIKEEDDTGSKTVSSWLEAGDILWPQKMTISSGQGQQVITFDSVAVNVEAPESMFVMPADAQPVPGMHEPPTDSEEPAGSEQPGDSGK